MKAESRGFLALELTFCIALSLLAIKTMGITLQHLSKSYAALTKTASEQRTISKSQDLARWRLSSEPTLNRFSWELAPPLVERNVAADCQKTRSSLAGQCSAICTFSLENNREHTLRIYASC